MDELKAARMAADRRAIVSEKNNERMQEALGKNAEVMRIFAEEMRMLRQQIEKRNDG